MCQPTKHEQAEQTLISKQQLLIKSRLSQTLVAKQQLAVKSELAQKRTRE